MTKEKIIAKTKQHPLYRKVKRNCSNCNNPWVWELYRMGLYGYPHLCLKCGNDFTVYHKGITSEEQDKQRKSWRLATQEKSDSILKKQGILTNHD